MALKNKGKKKNVRTSKPSYKPTNGVKVTGLTVVYSAASGQAVANWNMNATHHAHTDHYNARWDYKVDTTGGQQWIIGETRSTGTTRQSTFTVPDGALAVMCTVTPVAKDHETEYQLKKKTYSGKKDKKGNKIYYWKWTQYVYSVKWYNGANVAATADSSGSVTPEAPGAPVLSAGTGDGVNVGLSSDAGDALVVEVQLYTDGAWAAHDTGKVLGTYSAGEVTVANAFFAAAGHAYRVDARQQNTLTGAWSGFSSFSEVWQAPPLAPSGLTVASLTATSFSASWTKEGYSGDGFELRWGRDRDTLLLDELPEGAYSATTDGATAYTATIASGAWYFAVRGTSSDGNGAWSAIVAFTAGLTPAAPTIGELPAYAALGSTVTVPWTYNNADGSTQTAYEVQVSVDGGEWAALASGETSASSAAYTVAAQCETVAFRVRTKGAIDTWSPWGTSAAVSIDAPLTVTLSIGDATTLPLAFTFSADADVRLWHLVITAAASYVTTADDGSEEVIAAGALAFEGILQAGDEEFDARTVAVTLDLTTAELVSGCTYHAELSAISTHGLTDDDAHDFTAAWDGTAPTPTASIPPVDDDLEAHIFPRCDGEDGELLEGVTLAVYRLDSDNQPLLVADNLPNDGAVEIIDPHPSFGECWYRIAATTASGSMGFYDTSVDVDHDTVVLQFDDGLKSYSDAAYAAGEFDPQGYVEVPYNLSVTEKHDPDGALVEFVGNSDPTLYTGTQLGRTVAVDGVVLTSDDAEIVRRLRWLQGSLAAAYYRDPTGLGFWAWVTAQLTFDGAEPVSISLDVKRVEGDYTGRTV